MRQVQAQVRFIEIILRITFKPTLYRRCAAYKLINIKPTSLQDCLQYDYY